MDEVAILREELGGLPLIGLVTDAEIFDGVVHEAAGMLVLIGDRARHEPGEYPDRPIVGVGAVVWRGDRVLLIRRGKPPRAGQWSLPGGAQQLGETLREAITREVREETGLELAELRLLTTVDLIEREPDGRVRYHYTLVDFTAEAPAGEPLAGDDAVGGRLVRARRAGRRSASGRRHCGSSARPRRCARRA